MRAQKLLYLKQFYDEQFRHNKLKYFLQCLLITLILFIVLLSLNILPNVVVIASVASTAFIVFAAPHKNVSRPRYIIGGYLIGALVGSLCTFMVWLWPHHPILIANWHDEVSGAVAIGLSTFLMTVFNVEHPPSAALAFALVLREWSVETLVVTAIALFLILYFRRFLSPYLIDLM